MQAIPLFSSKKDGAIINKEGRDCECTSVLSSSAPKAGES